MAVYRRRTRVRAPFEEVWAFYTRAEGLAELSPDWLNLRVESVTGPDGEPDPEGLDPGTRIVSSVRPFGVGPRRRWLSVVEAREEGDAGGYFRDRMEEGPFPRWVHTHRFVDESDATLVEDRVEYRLPDGLNLLAPLARVGLEPVFRYRHRRTRDLLA